MTVQINRTPDIINFSFTDFGVKSPYPIVDNKVREK